MKEYYLVDGYNVINNWPEFAGIRDKDLEHARDLLTDQVAEFSAFRGYEAIVVFDAMDVKGPEATEHSRGCTVVYTAEGNRRQLDRTGNLSDCQKGDQGLCRDQR